MASPAFRRFRPRLTEVNDQLCYSYFSDEEARESIAHAAEDHPDSLTTQFFSNNPFSKRINIKNSELPKFRRKANSILAGMALISASEYLFAYVSEVEEFRSLAQPSSADLFKEEKPEEQLERKLTAWGRPPHAALTKTLGYLRLRRNHIAHANSEPNSSLLGLVKNSSTLVTKYWAKQPTKLSGLDFSSLNFASIGIQEAFALQNLCLVSMLKIDELIMATLSVEAIEMHEANKFVASNRDLKRNTPTVRHRKYKARFKWDYGYSAKLTEAELQEIWVRA